jgi:hypothetical protein
VANPGLEGFTFERGNSENTLRQVNLVFAYRYVSVRANFASSYRIRVGRIILDIFTSSHLLYEFSEMKFYTYDHLKWHTRRGIFFMIPQFDSTFEYKCDSCVLSLLYMTTLFGQYFETIVDSNDTITSKESPNTPSNLMQQKIKHELFTNMCNWEPMKYNCGCDAPARRIFRCETFRETGVCSNRRILPGAQIEIVDGMCNNCRADRRDSMDLA